MWTPGLLSRGSQVRVLPGALFPKEFADFRSKENRWRMQIEQSDQSGEFAPHLASFRTHAFREHFVITGFLSRRASRENGADHRPGIPEVAFVTPPPMAMCRRECVPRSAPDN